MKNKILVLFFLISLSFLLYNKLYLYNQNTITEIELSLKETFGEDSQRWSFECRFSDCSNFYWKRENGDYISLVISAEGSISKAKKFMIVSKPWISSGIGAQKVSSPFDEALFYKSENGGCSYFSVTAREKNIAFSITSNTRKYPNQIIEKLSGILL